MTKPRKYWLVHGSGPTNHRHAERGDAIIEARRLAAENPGRTFVVLEAVQAITHAPPPPPPIDVVHFDRNDDGIDIPF